MQTDNIRYQ